MKHTVQLFALIGVLLVTVGCGQKVAETAAEEAMEAAIENETGATDVEVDFDEGASYTVETDEGSISADYNEDGEGSFTFESEEGTVEYNTTTELPEDWPEDVPLPNGIEIVGTVSQGESIQTVSFKSTEKTSEELMEELKSGLLDNGWTEKASISSGSLYGYTAEKDGRVTSISLNQEPDTGEVVGSIAVGTEL